MFIRYLLLNFYIQKKILDTQNTILLWASWYGYYDVVTYVIDSGMNENPIPRDAFKYCMNQNHRNIFEYLLSKSQLYNEALIVASENNKFEYVKFLIENFSNDITSKNEAMRIATGNGSLDIIELLIPFEIESNYEKYLITACKMGHVHIVRYFAELGVPVDANSGDPLIQSAIYGHTEVAEFLLESGADVKNTVAFVSAIEKGHTSIVKILIKYGYDPLHVLILQFI